MTNVIVLFDDDDQDRGRYFETSAERLGIESSINTHYITTSTSRPVDTFIEKFDGQPFIFVAFTHGDIDKILVNGDPYVDKSSAYLFGSTLFYANACLTAKELGPFLVDESSCTIFLGYDSTITSCNAEAEPIYQLCENKFMDCFLHQGMNVQQSLKEMYTTYEQMKQHLLSEYGLFEANILNDNLSAFKVICSDDVLELTRTYFGYNDL